MLPKALKKLTIAPLLMAGATFADTHPHEEGKASDQDKQKSRAVVHASGENIKPVKVGEALPTLRGLRTADGNTFDLEELKGTSTIALVFYRGGWCPYCTVHLRELAGIVPTLEENGVKLLAITPDSPATLASYLEENPMPHTLLSDSTHQAMTEMGIAFSVDEATQGALKNYGIDLHGASGNQEAVLPVPSVFIVNREGVVSFVYTNHDYKERLDKAGLLRAAGIGEESPGDQQAN